MSAPGGLAFRLWRVGPTHMVAASCCDIPTSRHSLQQSGSGPTRGSDVFHKGSGHHFSGSSAAEVPPLVRAPAPPVAPTASSSDPIPFRRPDQPAAEAQRPDPEELHAADPPPPAEAPQGEIRRTGPPMPQQPEPLPVGIHGNARIISMCNQKGGVGKTTT